MPQTSQSGNSGRGLRVAFTLLRLGAWAWAFLFLAIVLLTSPVAAAEFAGPCDLIGPLKIQERTVLNPGRYCGGIVIDNANVVFNPGIYIIDSGNVTTMGTSTVTGEGVAFVFIGRTTQEVGDLKLGGDSTQSHLTPSDRGVYKGVLISRQPVAHLAQDGP